MIVLLDTSILLILEQKHINLQAIHEILGSYEFAVPTSVLEELEVISSRNGKKGKLAKAALSFASTLQKVNTSEDADTSLITLAKEYNAAVATMDDELIRRLKRAGITVLTLSKDRFILVSR
ncbi:MAG: PIN domain-containing protein [Nitrososphaerota archaeon]